MSDSERPHRRQPTRLPRPWDSPGENTGVGCRFLLQCMKVKSESEVVSCVRLFVTPWTAAHQAPQSMGFPRQEHWSGAPLPSDGISAPRISWFSFLPAVLHVSYPTGRILLAEPEEWLLCQSPGWRPLRTSGVELVLWEPRMTEGHLGLAPNR